MQIFCCSWEHCPAAGHDFDTFDSRILGYTEEVICNSVPARCPGTELGLVVLGCPPLAFS